MTSFAEELLSHINDNVYKLRECVVIDLPNILARGTWNSLRLSFQFATTYIAVIKFESLLSSWKYDRNTFLNTLDLMKQKKFHLFVFDFPTCSRSRELSKCTKKSNKFEKDGNGKNVFTNNLTSARPCATAILENNQFVTQFNNVGHHMCSPDDAFIQLLFGISSGR